MCGITGKFIFNQVRSVEEKEISIMNDALVHRGPNAEGIYIDGSLGLGHRRLSIIDLSDRGRQPMSDIEQTVWLSFNGEIYNFLELRNKLEQQGVVFRSDTDSEVIIHLYKQYGVECLSYLRGMFALAIWDKRKQQLFLARDRLGKKPLKYYIDHSVCIFASELKAILKNPEVKKQIDWGAIDEFLTYQYVPHPKTGFVGVSKLEPAHYLLISADGAVIKERYWSLSYEPKENYLDEEWEERIENKLRESVRLRLMSDVPLGVHLSGGIDSGMIVAMMARESPRPIKTFSMGFVNEKISELPYAKLVADRYGTDHQTHIITPDFVGLLPKLAYQYEEPFADPSLLPTWLLCEQTSKQVTVVLNGDGGDENFAGYARYLAMARSDQLQKLGFFINFLKEPAQWFFETIFHLTKYSKFHYSSALLKNFSRDLFEIYSNTVSFFQIQDKKRLYTNSLFENITHSRANTVLRNTFEGSNKLDIFDRLCFVDIQTYLPDDLLTKTDIASMAHALEVRSPFLDHTFMELVARMPSEFKVRGRRTKYILKQIAKKYLPEEILIRSKQGFGIPLADWIRGPFNPVFFEYLIDPKFFSYGFEKNEIERMLFWHKIGKQDYSKQLWALLMLRLWLMEWFEK